MSKTNDSLIKENDEREEEWFKEKEPDIDAIREDFFDKKENREFIEQEQDDSWITENNSDLW